MKWYWRDGTLAVDMSNPDWSNFSVQLRKLDKKLQDMHYKIVKQETLKNGYFVSTVWLGLDQSFSFLEPHAPLIFETMVFSKKGKYSELDMDRYATEKEALQGHITMVKKWSKKNRM